MERSAIVDAVSIPGPRHESGRKWLPALDGLRAFSIAWVIGFHLLVRDHLLFGEGAIRTLMFFGGQGVTVFFVLSGFLISSMLLKEEQQTGGIGLDRFYRRRAYRILPAALVYLAIALAFALLNRLPWNSLEWTSAVFFFRNLVPNDATSQLTGHFWSLSIEEQFYLIWPVMVMLISPRRRLSVTLWLCLLAPVWRYVAVKLAGGYVNTERIDLNYDNLLIGAVLALLQQRPQFRSLFDRYPLERFLLPLAIVAYFVQVRWGLSFGAIGAAASPTVQSMLIAVVLKILSEGRCPTAQAVCNFTPIRWLGRLSYSLYLWQTLFCEFHGSGVFWRVPWCLAATLVAAMGSYYFVEQPFLRLRDRRRATRALISGNARMNA